MTVSRIVSPASYIRIGMPVKCAFISEDDDEYTWYDGVITKVCKRGSTYADCNVQYDDGDVSKKQRFRNADYKSETTPSEDSWKFGISSINMLVAELMNERAKTNDLSHLLHSYQEANLECMPHGKKRMRTDGLECFELPYMSDDDTYNNDSDEDDDYEDDDSYDEDYEETESISSSSTSSANDAEEDAMTSPFDKNTAALDTEDDEEENTSNGISLYVPMLKKLQMFMLFVFVTYALKRLVKVSPCMELDPMFPCVRIGGCTSKIGRAFARLFSNVITRVFYGGVLPSNHHTTISYTTSYADVLLSELPTK